jgi:hypothetical protein
VDQDEAVPNIYTYAIVASHPPCETSVGNGKNAHFDALLYGTSTLVTSGGRMITETSQSNTGFVES